MAQQPPQKLAQKTAQKSVEMRVVQAICGVPDSAQTGSRQIGADSQQASADSWQPAHPLAAPLLAWCAASRPFLAFAEANTGKLRKKVREARTADQQGDLHAELLIAAWLLRPRATPLHGKALAYEPLKAGGGRSPDFAFTLPGGVTTYVEAARLHSTQQHSGFKLARVLAGKVGQLRPGAANVLAVVLGDLTPAAALVPAALHRLARAAQDEGLPGVSAQQARDFERGRARLSGVLLLGSAEPGGVTLWTPDAAAHPLPAAALRLLRDSC